MTLLTTVVLGMVVGALLGFIGAGGSVLTVPLLVYVAGEPVKEATTESLLVVAAAAAAGGVVALRAGLVDVRTTAPFAAAAIAGALVGTVVNRSIDADALLAGFGLVMLAAAFALRRAHGRAGRPRGNVARVVALGLGVGILTGVFGVGGGFVIVPALVLGLGLPIDKAVASSLIVIALAASTGFAAHVASGPLDWELALVLAGAAVGGSLAGRRLAGFVPRYALVQAFAVVLASVGIVTFADGVASLA